MPLYTLRVRLTMPGGWQRGSGQAEMVHHFQFPFDDTAIAALSGTSGRWSNGVHSKRWTAQRGGEMVHDLTLYRRDITDYKSWHRLHHESFALDDLADDTGPQEIGGVSLIFTFSEKQWMPDQRGAVLVRLRDASRTHQSRVYIGPLSPCANYGHLDIPLLGSLFGFWGTNLSTFDSPMNPDDDTVHLWRQRILHDSLSHVSAMDTIAGDDGRLVIPSWRHGAWYTAAYLDASPVRAIIKTRGVRAGMTEEVDIRRET